MIDLLNIQLICICVDAGFLGEHNEITTTSLYMGSRAS